MATANLLIGYRFRPTDQELLYLLSIKAKGGQLHPRYPIVERSLFGENPPWKVLNDNDPWEYVCDGDGNSTKKTIFVYGKLVGLGKTRAVRTTACGTWDGKAANNRIKNSKGVVIGHRKYYTFKANNGLDTRNNGKWMMHEYSFPNDKSGSVLCKITVDRSSYDMSAGGASTSVSVDKAFRKRKSSTSLDDGGSRKVSKGSGSWSGQETVLTELDECGRVCDVSYLLVGYNDDQTLQHPSFKNECEVLRARGMQGQQIIEDYNGSENIMFAASYDCSLPTMQQSESQQVKEILDCGTRDDILKETNSVTSVGYDVSYPLVGYNDEQTLQHPSIKNVCKVLRARGKQGQQIIEDYNGLENITFAASYDCSFPTMQQSESQQVKEILDCGTLDDILKEMHSVTSVGYNMSTTCGAGRTSTIIDQFKGKREQSTILDKGISKACEGSGSESERVTVTDEIGTDLSDMWACIGDDPKFQIPLVTHEFEFPGYSWGMQELPVPYIYGLKDFHYVTSNDFVAAAELLDSCPTTQQTEIQQVNKMSAGGTLMT